MTTLKAVKASKQEAPKSTSGRKLSLIEVIRSRQTEELVFAFCGPLGSGTSMVARLISAKLKSCGYKDDSIAVIKLSKLICDNAVTEGFESLVEGKSKLERTRLLQDEGNNLRKAHGNDILAQYAIKEISLQRAKEAKDSETLTEEGEPILLRSRRHVTIIDSLKHPDEVSLMQTVYGNMFYLFGVLCPEEIRLERLKDHDPNSGEAACLIARDRSESIKHGQQLLRTIYHADFFIRNTKSNQASLEKPIVRFIELILGANKYTPTLDEYAMFMAQAAALRSGCMSRQVGAAIVSESGDIIATGRNDVPRFGGGLYCAEDGENDNRCIACGDGECSSDTEKKKILEDLKNALKDKLKDKDESIINALADDFSNNERLKGLIEFSRAVHAEMDAITTAARMGGAGLRNGILYCTTFPCHHCARHIVAAGIKKVFYIEPYEKSLAPRLHKDSIAVEKPGDAPIEGKLTILPFEGVAPRKYLQLFAADGRKKSGVKVEIDFSQAKPVVQKFLDTHVDYESRVVAFLEKVSSEKKID
ncbi:anti-phage dCTP deaminase [Desulfocurvibacter africanus]|uniref:anti-phage dCTP deaminase n=1 Tax=Desulfocurvibacter africanus TaxID=873 RepID=UPI002FDB1C15